MCVVCVCVCVCVWVCVGVRALEGGGERERERERERESINTIGGTILTCTPLHICIMLQTYTHTNAHSVRWRLERDERGERWGRREEREGVGVGRGRERDGGSLAGQVSGFYGRPAATKVEFPPAEKINSQRSFVQKRRKEGKKRSPWYNRQSHLHKSTAIKRKAGIVIYTWYLIGFHDHCYTIQPFSESTQKVTTVIIIITCIKNGGFFHHLHAAILCTELPAIN